TLKTRRQAARRALPELAALGWTVSEYAKNKFEIGRPKATHLLGPAPKTQEISHTA
ncbi:replication protein C, IncQ-type, partial [Citrobacter amalonaticus]